MKKFSIQSITILVNKEKQLITSFENKTDKFILYSKINNLAEENDLFQVMEFSEELNITPKKKFNDMNFHIKVNSTNKLNTLYHGDNITYFLKNNKNIIISNPNYKPILFNGKIFNNDNTNTNTDKNILVNSEEPEKLNIIKSDEKKAGLIDSILNKTNKEDTEKDKQKKELDEKHKKLIEYEKHRKDMEEKQKKILEEEKEKQKKLLEEEEAVKKKLADEEETNNKKLAEEEEAKKKKLVAEEAKKKKLVAEEEAKKKKLAAEEEEAKKKKLAAEEEAKKKKLVAEEEAKKKKLAVEEEEAKKKKLDAEEEEAKKKKLAVEEEEAKKKKLVTEQKEQEEQEKQKKILKSTSSEINKEEKINLEKIVNDFNSLFNEKDNNKEIINSSDNNKEIINSSDNKEIINSSDNNHESKIIVQTILPPYGQPLTQTLVEINKNNEKVEKIQKIQKVEKVVNNEIIKPFEELQPVMSNTSEKFMSNEYILSINYQNTTYNLNTINLEPKPDLNFSNLYKTEISKNNIINTYLLTFNLEIKNNSYLLNLLNQKYLINKINNSIVLTNLVSKHSQIIKNNDIFKIGNYDFLLYSNSTLIIPVINKKIFDNRYGTSYNAFVPRVKNL